jgi:hypothetical protein
MSSTYVNSQSSTGTCTATAPATAGVTWNLTSLSVSQAGGVSGTSAKLTIYDGAIGGTVLFAVFLNGPGALGTGLGSVGTIQDISMPKDNQGRPCLQATPGNAMNIQVVGTGGNAVSINARISDGLP